MSERTREDLTNLVALIDGGAEAAEVCAFIDSIRDADSGRFVELYLAMGEWVARHAVARAAR